MSRRSLAPPYPPAPYTLGQYMPMPCTPASRTATIARALTTTRNHTANNDYLFLEAWERRASPDLAALLRISQIRRANPILVAELRAEIATGRPLTEAERARL